MINLSSLTINDAILYMYRIVQRSVSQNPLRSFVPTPSSREDTDLRCSLPRRDESHLIGRRRTSAGLRQAIIVPWAVVSHSQASPRALIPVLKILDTSHCCARPTFVRSLRFISFSTDFQASPHPLQPGGKSNKHHHSQALSPGHHAAKVQSPRPHHPRLQHP